MRFTAIKIIVYCGFPMQQNSASVSETEANELFTLNYVLICYSKGELKEPQNKNLRPPNLLLIEK